jgi:hypothetical protein
MTEEKKIVPSSEQKLAEKFSESKFDGEDLAKGDAEPNMSNEAKPESGQEVSEEMKSNKKQSKEDNAKFAEMRRQQEAEKAQKAMLEKAQKEAYTKGVIEGIGGKNPYTGEPIKDELDLQEYQDMRSLESQGKDPVTSYAAFVKEKQRQQAQLVQQQEVSKKKAQEFINDFEAKYPGKFKEIWEDSLFQDYADGKLNGNKTLIQVYEGFLSLVGRKAEIIADRKVSKAIASPGSMTGDSSEIVPNIDWRKMNEKDFKQFVEKAKRGEFRK